MASEATPLRVAQSVGILLSAYVGGGNLWNNSLMLPGAAKHAPGPALAKMWQDHYNSGKVTAISSILLSSAAWVFSLYTVGTDAPRAQYMIGALALNLAFVPYTLILMEPGVNKRLHEYNLRAEANEEFSEATSKAVKDEVLSWVNYNYVRAVFGITSATLGLMTLW